MPGPPPGTRQNVAFQLPAVRDSGSSWMLKPTISAPAGAVTRAGADGKNATLETATERFAPGEPNDVCPNERLLWFVGVVHEFLRASNQNHASGEGGTESEAEVGRNIHAEPKPEEVLAGLL